MTFESPDPFKNDFARQFALHMPDQKDIEAGLDLLQRVQDTPAGSIPLKEAAEIIGAAEIVAALFGRMARTFEVDLKLWVQEHRGQLDRKWIKLASVAIDRVTQNSELRDYWVEQEQLEVWEKTIQELQVRLSPLKRSSTPPPPIPQAITQPASKLPYMIDDEADEEKRNPSFSVTFLANLFLVLSLASFYFNWDLMQNAEGNPGYLDNVRTALHQFFDRFFPEYVDYVVREDFMDTSVLQKIIKIKVFLYLVQAVVAVGLLFRLTWSRNAFFVFLGLGFLEAVLNIPGFGARWYIPVMFCVFYLYTFSLFLNLDVAAEFGIHVKQKYLEA